MPAAATLTPDAEARVLVLFRKPSLRTGQRELISWALAGENALAVLPTGHGKSLCYQAAAMLLGGLSVVVSPLIALMRDQVEALAALGLPAGRFDSSLDEEERTALLQRVAAGELRLLFVAPESLENAALGAALDATRLSLFVVDEAHCVSAWGHSFRPDYLRLPRWWKGRGFSSVLALTATATPLVRRDLMAAFGIPGERVLAFSPYRANIRRLVQAVADEAAQQDALVDFLRAPENCPAIVYTRTRKGAEEVAGMLQRAGFAAACYHAGQPAELRARLQDDFLANELEVLVATIAFGMGIDKPDVRSVIHVNLPSSPEAYLQESGRAGRDGAPCTSLVFLNGGDAVEARNRIAAAEPDAEGILRCVRWLLPPPGACRVISLWELGTSCDVADDIPVRALERLAEQGAVEVAAEGMKFYKLRPLFPLETILDGRDETECARLRWLDTHREGEVEEAADVWDCSFGEAMDWLRECEAAGEWKLRFRQRALCLRGLPPLAALDSRTLAAELTAYYAQRRERDLARQEELLSMLTAGDCFNAALNRYFMEGDAARLHPRHTCGHCSACEQRGGTALPPYTPPAHPAPAPAPGELPEFAREGQRRRFLLGIASPGIMSRRLWAHPYYGCCAGIPWQEV